MSGHDDSPLDRKNPPGPPSASAGWAVTSYLIGGMAVYGGIGWLVARWTGVAALFTAGALEPSGRGAGAGTVGGMMLTMGVAALVVIAMP